jgi:hypothetical protein
MKFPRMLCERTPEPCATLRAAHIPDAPPFVAFTLYGSDNEPAQLDLYDVCPDHTTKPFATYHRVDGELVTEYVAPTTPSLPASKAARKGKAKS